MPEPTVTRIPTPPGSVIRVSVEPEQDQEQTFTFAEELHRQTGLPVVVVTPGADLTVTAPEEAEAALTVALEDSVAELDAIVEVSAEQLLDALRQNGWELVRVRQP